MARFEFDPAASLMSLEIRSSLHTLRADTGGVRGWIEGAIGPASRTATVSAGHLCIPLATLSTHNSLYDAEVHRRINTRSHGTAEGLLLDWRATAQVGRYLVRGQVSFRGVEREVQDEMTLSWLDEETVVLEGARVFDIRDFGLDPPRLLTLRVDPAVTICVAVVGRRVD